MGGKARLVGIESKGKRETAVVADGCWKEECLNAADEEDGAKCRSMHVLDGFEMATCCCFLCAADGKPADTLACR